MELDDEAAVELSGNLVWSGEKRPISRLLTLNGVGVEKMSEVLMIDDVSTVRLSNGAS